MKHGNDLLARRILALLLAAGGTFVFLPVRVSAEAADSGPVLLEIPWNERSGKAPSPTNRQECYEECDYQYGKDTEKCKRLPKNKRPECYSKALAKRTECRNECEKKFPE